MPHLPLLAVTRERGVIDRELVEKRDTSSEDKSKYKRVLRGDIVYNTMRMWQGVSGLAEREGLVSPAYTVTSPRGGADGRFLAFLLKYPPLVRAFRAFSQGLVDDTLSLRYSELARILVRVPSLREQRKIAAILSSVDDAIEKTQAVIEQVQVVKKGLMQELLTRGLPGRHTKFKQTEVGAAPEAWEVRALGEVASIGNGTTPSKERDDYWIGGTVPWFPTGRVNDRIIRTPEAFVTERAVAETPQGSPENRPVVIGAKPASRGGGETESFCVSRSPKASRRAFWCASSSGRT